MPKTGIPDEERFARINAAFTALMLKTPFDTLGMKSFCEFARKVVIDSSIPKPHGIPCPNIQHLAYGDPKRQALYAIYADKIGEWRLANIDSDDQINGGYSGKPLDYLKKHHPEIYQGLLPWLEVNE